MPTTAYEEAYKQFKNQYGVEMNLYVEYVNGKNLIGIDDFSADVSEETKEVTAYVSTLTSAFREYFNKKTKIANNKSYDTSDVSLSDFIVDFDKLMKGIRTSEAEENKEPPIATCPLQA